jgi:hypothetical protein
MEGDSIASVTGWQLTTQTYHSAEAAIFADCSGDGVLAPLTGHPFRMGREARSEYGESIAPEHADERTMGMTCLIQAREHDTPQRFVPPAWAHRYDSPDEIPYGRDDLSWWRIGYWWVELGGEDDAIHDTETLREELLRIALGLWDHIKNRGDYGADNWALEWIQFLPAKRESRRYVGAHVLTQNDIESEGRFEDLVAYGGWTMDDHHPAGFRSARIGAPPTIYHPGPSPYGIPYRSLYSQHVPNLMFAGRCHSATHAALSSTRVMGTCSSMGQALGTAAAMAAAGSARPADVLDCIRELQQRLLRDDCYLPWVTQEMSALTRGAELSASRGDPEPVRDGVSRPVGETPHCWYCRRGDWIAYAFATVTEVREITVALDSALDRDIALSLFDGHVNQLNDRVPDGLPRRLRLEVQRSGEWVLTHELTENRQRFVRLPIDQPVEGLRLTIDELWGGRNSRVYAFYVD